MQSAREKKLIIALFIYTIAACGTIDQSDDAKVIIHQKKYEDTIHGAGRKIEVEFTDGESITGYALGYSPDRHGFFVTPADLKSNNVRVFVVKSATTNIKFP